MLSQLPIARQLLISPVGFLRSLGAKGGRGLAGFLGETTGPDSVYAPYRHYRRCVRGSAAPPALPSPRQSDGN